MNTAIIKSKLHEQVGFRKAEKDLILEMMIELVKTSDQDELLNSVFKLTKTIPGGYDPHEVSETEYELSFNDMDSLQPSVYITERKLNTNLNKYKMKELQEILKYTKDLVEQEPEKSAYWHYNKLVSKIEEAIDVIQCCTLLVCVDDNDLPNLTQDNEYKLIVETNRHYNIIDDNGNDILVSKKYFRQLKKAN